eukprot:scpid7460/ scgid0352/ Filamin-C; ABP-280-like protein; ABP-L; Actin-binding-like protein; Filamin-2; Gamma-filamin
MNVRKQNEKALDAEWKRIQQKTFTRWCNEHLKKASLFVRDLSADLTDGTNLIALLEMLSEKKVGRYNKRPKNYPQSLENVAIAVRFIHKENIRLVNIGGEDIAQGNIKLILGMIWTLILHYQISVALGGDGKAGPPPKQALLTWLQGMLKDRKKIRNLTKDWNDGTVIAALVDAMAPGLMPDWNELDPENAVENATRAMKLAEDWLGVPMVLAPGDMCNPHVDELSMMTYLSQFPDAKLKDGAPLNKPTDALACSARGPGLEPTGVKQTRQAPFTVYTPKKTQGKLTITCNAPDGREVPVKVGERASDGTYACSYVPEELGEHVVTILYNKSDIPRSPFKVGVEPISDPARCRAWGPGVDGGGLVEQKPAKFNVKTKGAGEGDLSYSVTGPDGNELGPDFLKLSQDMAGQYSGSYTPNQAGPHTVVLKWADQHIPGSPFEVNVAPTPPDAKKVRAVGPGVESQGLVCGQPALFQVISKDAGRGELDVNVRGRGGDIPCEIVDNGDDTFDCQYVPQDEGEVFVKVRWSQAMIPKSPFRVSAQPPVDASKCEATGPGVEPMGLRVNQAAPFKVSTKGAGPGKLDVDIVNPGGNKMPYDMHSIRDGSGVTYTPVFPGQYKVAVTFDGNHIPNSPFDVGVTDPSRVRISGPGITDDQPLKVGVPVRYEVDTSEAGPGDLAATHQWGNKAEQPCTVEQTGPDTCSLEFTPERAGTEKVNLTYGGFPVPTGPFPVNVLDPSKVKVHGRGVEPGLITGQPAPFVVDCREAGDGPISVRIEGPANTKLDSTTDRDRSQRCVYYPKEPGTYEVHVKFADEPLPISPISVEVAPCTDPGRVVVSGPGVEPTGLVSSNPTYFDIDARMAGEGDVDVSVTGPERSHVPINIVDNKDSTFRCHYEPRLGGDHTIVVKFAGTHAPKSPFAVKVKWATDPAKVKVWGDDLDSGVAGIESVFHIDDTEAGDGNLDVLIEGPQEAKMKMEKNPDGTKTCRYTPPVEGDYYVHVKFNDTEVPDSPFKAEVDPQTDANRVRAYGPGLRPEGVRVGDAGNFKIDTQGAGRGNLEVKVDAPKPRSSKVQVAPSSDGPHISDAVYNPTAVGTYNVNILYAGDHIYDSPYTVGVSDPTKCKITGPGVDNRELARVGKPVEYVLDATQAGPGAVKAAAKNPTGAQVNLDVEPMPNSNGKYKLSFVPDDAGTYNVTATHAGHAIPKVPFALGSVDPTKVKVSGDGLDGGRVNEMLPIDVDAREAGPGGLNLGLEGPGQAQADVVDNKDGTFRINFVPSTAGEYRFNMKFADEEVPGTPFRIPVRNIKNAKVSGLDKAPYYVGEEICATVDTRKAGPPDTPVTARVQSPSGGDFEPDVEMPAKGYSKVKFVPEEPGVYELNLGLLGEDLEDMPAKLEVSDPSRCEINKGGLECACVGEPVFFTVDTADAGPGELDVMAKEARNKKLPIDIHPVADQPGRYEVEFVPTQAGDVEVPVLFAGRSVPGAPLIVPVADPSKCTAQGPGLEPTGLKAHRQTFFDINTAGAGVGEVDVSIVNTDTMQALDFDLSEASKATHHVEYNPDMAGHFEINLRFAGKLVAQSPYSVSVSDPSRVTAHGPALEGDSIVNEPAHFTVDKSEAGDGELEIAITGPSTPDVETKDNGDGTVDVTFVATQPGRYDVKINFDDEEVPKSPYTASIVRPPPDASKANVKDLSAQPLVNERNEFTVDASAAGGNGLLEIGVQGGYVPAEEITVRHVGDFVFAINYQINEEGETMISVKWHGEHVPGSPFRVYVSNTGDAIDL